MNASFSPVYSPERVGESTHAEARTFMTRVAAMANRRTPENVQVQPTATGIAGWLTGEALKMLGKLGIGAVGFVLAYFLYTENVKQRDKYETMIEKRIEEVTHINAALEQMVKILSTALENKPKP